MRELFYFQEKMAPELIRILERRYTILSNVLFHQPIGRRALSLKVKLGERIVRNETEFMRENNLLLIHGSGMEVTSLGEEILKGLEEFIYISKGLADLEKKLQVRLGLDRIIVVAGDSDCDEMSKKAMGQKGAELLKHALTQNLTNSPSVQILAVTGGSSTLEVAKAVTAKYKVGDSVVVPARGAFGEELETQANHVAGLLAQNLGTSYKLLHLPDNLSPKGWAYLSQEASVKEVIDLVEKANIVIHGIGCAKEMSKRRGLSNEEINSLMEQGAIGEALGYYFNNQGQIIETQSGFHLYPLKSHETTAIFIAVAGGSSKARAVEAVLKGKKNQWLITDEGVARSLLALPDKQNS